MKYQKLISSLSLIVIVNTTYAQDVKKQEKAFETKMDAFSSKTGSITKFIDYKLTKLKLKYGESAETRVRKINSASTNVYFFQIVNQGKYGSTTASIEYSDLLEVIKALKALKGDEEKDITSNADYLENKFTTVDGFQVGYFVDKGKSGWYLKLEKYGSDNTIFLDASDKIDAALTEAKAKIEDLKAQKYNSLPE